MSIIKTGEQMAPKFLDGLVADADEENEAKRQVGRELDAAIAVQRA